MPTPLDTFVAVDVEVASRSPVRICAIGAARVEQGREAGAFRSLVYAAPPVRFTRIHGLRAADLRNAPRWPEVWSAFGTFAGDVKTLVAYGATFDRGALLAMCALEGVRMPRFRFTCAARLFEARFGTRLDLASAIQALGLPFPGRPHDPLADARAAAAVALACDLKARTELTLRPA